MFKTWAVRFCNLKIQELEIPGCLLFEPTVFNDDRGKFYEWYQILEFNQGINFEFNLAQANCSVSKKGVLRGIHFTSKLPGQSKLVTVLSGKVFDVLVDLRKKSPSFGKWQSVVLEGRFPKTIYIPWGVGHGFMSLEDDTVFSYLCDASYNPENEFDLNAFDESLDIKWPLEVEVIQSQKDKNAPSLESINSLLPN